MSQEQLSKSSEYTLWTIYEMVIHNDPATADLLEGNSLTDQKIVMAHVLGHVERHARCSVPSRRVFMCHFVPGCRNRGGSVLFGFVSTLCVALIAQQSFPDRARACGCFSPPVPSPDVVEFAVNQQAELLIFEVESGADPHVTAHVLIKYAGDADKFAWLIPVPAVPELSLSHSEAFALIDEQTRPVTRVDRRSACPGQQWECQVHPPPFCPTNGFFDSYGDGDGDGDGDGQAAPAYDSGNAYGSGGVGGSSVPPVVVYAEQKVGDYETVTIGAGDGSAAVAWLNDQGFIVNASMGRYMQPYLDAGMLFVASKLQPDADVDELRPLRMRYAGDTPAIPLRLTAVAAEPHLTVTAFIYADEAYEPFGHPIVDVPEDALGSPDGLADNYPSLLSRLVDEAGGDGFALEYYGPPPVYQDPNPQCCNGGQVVGLDGGVESLDLCGVGSNGSCECPRQAFDAEDCDGDGGPAAAIELVDALASAHTRLTRLTTRLSPEEMTFDPVFRPMWGPEPAAGRRSHVASHVELTACRGDIVDAQAYDDVLARQRCAGVYCGPDAECAVTDDGVGCACGATELARVYTDLDGGQSVTCVPQQGTVDFREGGLELPDACEGLTLTTGAECFDIGGFPTVLCPEGQAAVSTGQAVPACRDVVAGTGGPGARNYTGEVHQIEVCAPAPPSCPPHGWLVERGVSIVGTQCESSIPDPSWLVKPPKPTCDDYTAQAMDTRAVRAPASRRTADTSLALGCGCRAAGGTPGGRGSAGGLGLLLMSGALWLRRRRRIGRG